MPAEGPHHLLVFFCTDTLFGIVLSVCTPVDYLAALLWLKSQQLPVWPQASELFFNQVFHSPDLYTGFSIHFLEFCILFFQLFEFGYITCFHTAILGFPVVKCGVRDAYFTADVFDRNAGFLLLDSCHYLN